MLALGARNAIERAAGVSQRLGRPTMDLLSAARFTTAARRSRSSDLGADG